jgi:hypothetical protein
VVEEARLIKGREHESVRTELARAGVWGYLHRGVYKCYIATSPVNKGESEGRKCYINCYKLQRQVLHSEERRVKNGAGLRLRDPGEGIPIPLGVKTRYPVTLSLTSGTYDDFTRYPTRYQTVTKVLPRSKR